MYTTATTSMHVAQKTMVLAFFTGALSFNLNPNPLMARSTSPSTRACFMATSFNVSPFMSPPQQFDAMLASVALPSAALACVESGAQRTLLRGTSAVQEDALVRRAFAILYEDMAMFRPAGNGLLRQLADCASTAERLSASLSASGLTALDNALPWLRALFDSIDADGDGSLDPRELRAATLEGNAAAAAKLCLGSHARRLSFAEFVKLIAPTQGASGGLQGASVWAASVAEHVATLQPARSARDESGWGSRFDHMASEFLTWEDKARWEGRKGEVIAGGFAGVRNPELRAAVRAVYCESAVLRGAGDVVFRMLRPPSARAW